MHRSLIFLVPLVLLGPMPSLAGEAGDLESFGPAEEKRILEITERLTSHPLQLNKTEVRDALHWWAVHPRLKFKHCVEPFTESKNAHLRNLIIAAGILGAGAHLIRHPGLGEDLTALYLAGVARALRLYRNAVLEKEAFRDEAYDRIIELQEAGTLEAWVEKKLEKCRSRGR